VAGGDRALEDQPVTALAPAPGESVWAIASKRHVWRSDGEGWRDVARVAEEDLALRCILPLDDRVFLGTSGAHLLELRDGDLKMVGAFDEVEGRDGWYTPWGGPPDTRSLTAASNGTIYANVHVGGIVRSNNDHWEPTIDVDADVHQVLVHPQHAATVLAACAYGLAISQDAGETWSIDAEGLHGRYCRAVALAGDTVLVTASTGPFTDRAAVYRRPLGENGPFERCTTGLPEWFPSNVDTHCLAADGAHVALGTDAGDVYRSDDAGRTWERIPTGLPPVRAVLLTD
jgi:hypothetical protein